MQHPACWDLVRDGDELEPCNQERASNGPGKAGELSTDPTSVDEAEVVEILRKRLTELRQTDLFTDGAFQWRLREGKWTAEHHGSAYGSYKAQARVNKTS